MARKKGGNDMEWAYTRNEDLGAFSSTRVKKNMTSNEAAELLTRALCDDLAKKMVRTVDNTTAQIIRGISPNRRKG